MKKLVLISGKKNTGKDTFAEYFLKEHFKRIALSDELKIQLKKFLFISFDKYFEMSNFHDKDKRDLGTGISLADETEMTFGNALQWYDQIMKDRFGYDYWVMKMVEVCAMKHAKFDFVLTDLKFPYEIDYFYRYLGKEYEIFTIRINRDTGIEDTTEFAINDKEDDYFDFVVDNNSTLGDLELSFLKIFSTIKP